MLSAELLINGRSVGEPLTMYMFEGWRELPSAHFLIKEIPIEIRLDRLGESAKARLYYATLQGQVFGLKHDVIKERICLPSTSSEAHLGLMKSGCLPVIG